MSHVTRQRGFLVATRLLLGVWTCAVLVAGSVLSSFHQPFLINSSGIEVLLPKAASQNWQAIHLLDLECGCSQRVLRHLRERGPLPGVEERIIVFEGARKPAVLAEFKALGWRVETFDDKRPTGKQVLSVPLLIYLSPDGKIRYQGGYGPTYREDVHIWRQLQSGNSPRVAAAYGCAVGQRLQRALDPFAWKYRN